MKILRPDDWHAHLRDGEMLKRIIGCHDQYNRVLVMPNLVMPIINLQMAKLYRKRILDLSVGFKPVMTLKMHHGMTSNDLIEASREGVRHVKLYPTGVTTGSFDGINRFDEIDHLLAVMQERKMILCIHAEEPGVPALDAERCFLERVYNWNNKFPELKMVIEHASTEEAISVAQTTENIACSITAHHLVLTIDDVLGQCHNHCKPVAKTEKDKFALITAATSGSDKIFFGSDSAPHTIEDKNAGAAGCFTSPLAIEILASVFEQQNKLKNLSHFTSIAGACFHGYEITTKTIDLERVDWRISENSSIRSFWAGRKLSWKVC